MKNKNLFLLLVLFSVSVTKAQELGISIQESKVFKMTASRVQNDYILPDNQGGFITISTKRNGFLVNPMTFESYVTHYDSDMKQVVTKTFKMNKGAVKANIKGAFVANGNLYMLEMESNLRNKYYAFKKVSGNIDEGKVVSEEEFFRINFVYPKTDVNLFVNPESLFYQKIKYYSDINFFNPKIFFKFSKNNRFFTIIYRDLAQQPAIYHIKVFNRDFEPVYSQDIIYDGPSNLFYINDILVDDATGDVYLTAKIYKSDPSNEKRVMNTDNTQSFMVYRATSDDLSEYLITPKKVIEKLYLQMQDEITVFGFFRNKFLDTNDINGFFRLNLSKELDLIMESYQKFGDQLVKVTKGKSFKKSKNHQMIVRNAFMTDDGSLIVNAEDLYAPLMMKRVHREESIREIVGDIFSINIGTEGQINWAEEIYKKQAVKPRLAIHSFFNAFIDQQNYFIFTDSTLEEPEENNPFYLQGHELRYLNAVKISNDSPTEKAVLYKKNFAKFRFMPIEGVMIDAKTAIIPAKDHMFIKFFKLSFE